MEELQEKHILITQEVKSLISDVKIVFPSYYGRLFSNTASKYDVELKGDQLLDREFIDEKIFRYIITLYHHADDALDAMLNNNTDKLINVIEETRRLKEELSHLHKIIYEDSLTHVFNRQWFDDNYVLSDSSPRFKNSGVLVLVDMNDFKMINDTYGHVIGDKVLHYMAQSLKGTGGKVVRYGGDEFMILFESNESEKVIANKIEKIFAHFQKVSFKHEEHTFKIGFAYGVATFKTDDVIDQVIDLADKSMYKNKSMRKLKAG